MPGPAVNLQVGSSVVFCWLLPLPCSRSCVYAYLRARKTQRAYRDAGVKLWQIPPRSPDLNPVERFWSWLRRKLRFMDLKDAVAKRPVLGKMAYKSRVRSVRSSQQAQRVAMGA